MKRILTIGVISAAAIMAAAFAWRIRDRETPPRVVSPAPLFSGSAGSSALPVIDTRAFINLASYRRLVALNDMPDLPEGHALAGVLNHHDLANDLMARYGRALAELRPDLERIILIAPDHYHAAQGDIATHARPYLTPSGTVTIDAPAVERLVQSGFATTENGQLFEREHGVGALVPYLAAALPDVEIIPITIRGTIDRAQAAKLGVYLAPLLDDRTFVLLSADMSHYLAEDVALANDQKTLEAITRRDTEFFRTASDAYTDNGASFVALFSLFSARGLAPTFHLFDHSISSRYAGPTNNTTSYLTGVWTMY